jgi:hypothetical protein
VKKIKSKDPVQNLIAVLIATTLLSCKEKTGIQHTGGLDFHAIAEKILEQARVQKGERILLVIKPGRFDPLVVHLKDHIEEAGGIYLGTVSTDSNQPEEWTTAFSQSLSGMNVDELTGLLAEVDLGLMLPGATPQNPVYAALQQLLHNGHGRTIHFH